MSKCTDREPVGRGLLLPVLVVMLISLGCHGSKKAKDQASTAPAPAPVAAAPAPLPPPPIPQGQIIDQVIANVANRVVLYSDLASRLDQARRDGEPITNALACGQLEDLLYEQLLLEQARIDSAVVDDKQVDAELERRIMYFERQIGGRDKLEEYYGKRIEEIKADFRDQVADQIMAQQMQQKVTGDRRVTPKEVERFFRNIPPDSLPFINATVEFGRIVKYARPNEAEDRRVKKKLEDLRNRINEGKVSFDVAATLNSQDPGSAARGGELGMVPQGVMVAEFDAVALSMKDGEVSQVFKTEYGYHVMKMLARRGEQYNAAHILIKLETSGDDLKAAKAYLDSVANLIREGKVSFAKAATEMNDDEDTKGTNGIVIEPDHNSPRWSIGDLDKETFFVLDKMKEGELSEARSFEQPTGEKGYRVFMLMKRTAPHTMDLVEDYPLVSEGAEGEMRQRAVGEWVRDKLSGTFVRIIPDYAGCPFQHPWITPPGE